MGVKISIGKSKTIDYDEMPLRKLRGVIKRNRMFFIITATVYFLVGGISTLVVYSFDPVFAVALVTVLFGIMSICLYLFFMLSKLIWFLRVLTGEKEKIEEKEQVRVVKDSKEIEEESEKIY